MQAVIHPPKRAHQQQPKGTDAFAGSKQAHGEISAYIAVRDLLLEKAEGDATLEAIRSARLANEFVETCLGEVRLPYEAQYLNESDSVRARKNCAAANERIAALEQRARASL